MRRVLVAISHPEVSAGVFELLRHERGLAVHRSAPSEAPALAEKWAADLIVVDAAIAHRLSFEVRPRMVIAAAGDGAIARVTAERLGTSWLFVDELARELPRLLRGTPPAKREAGSRGAGFLWRIGARGAH